MNEYTCTICHHGFPSIDIQDLVSCPRCGSSYINSNPWLLGSSTTRDLTDEHHFELSLAT